jgi:hypothetical protein
MDATLEELVGLTVTSSITSRRSPIPPLAPLALNRGDGGGADLYPCATRARPMGAAHSLGNDALGPEQGRKGEHGRPIFGNVFAKQDAGLEIAQQLRLAVKERATAHILAIESRSGRRQC